MSKPRITLQQCASKMLESVPVPVPVPVPVRKRRIAPAWYQTRPVWRLIWWGIIIAVTSYNLARGILAAWRGL